MVFTFLNKFDIHLQNKSRNQPFSHTHRKKSGDFDRNLHSSVDDVPFVRCADRADVDDSDESVGALDCLNKISLQINDQKAGLQLYRNPAPSINARFLG